MLSMKIINHEVSKYAIFGVLTTLVNILTYIFLTKVLAFDYKTATVIAWIASVLFAYYTNKKYVFNARYTKLIQTLKSFFLFVFYRLLSLLVDLAVMYVLIEFFYLDDLLTKIIANVVVVIFNYITSKWHVFSKKEREVE
ncbi:cell wall teichoic acid glycosylation protein GtcA [Salinibacillus aidingensis]|uniref:Cell wall teichoic acid glycosylation protein GtcA n=3 Tax=Bacteria TaxID=2 RepID=A0ABN1AYT7_9BACI